MGVTTPLYNVSAAYAEVWQGTIDRLQKELENARDIPAWAIAVVVLCAVSTFCVLVVCGFGCGMLVHQNYNTSKSAAAEHSSLLSSDSALHSPTANGAEDDTVSAGGNPRVVARMSSKKAGKRVKAAEDDMEL